VDQRSIYDLRYSGAGYDERSAVRVLTAETVALRTAVHRAAESIPGSSVISLFDFGYGTGRVTNDFAVKFSRLFGDLDRDLHVIAYDVSAVGLRKAARWLTKDHGFDVFQDLTFDMVADHGYVAGSTRRMFDNTTVTVTFIHGSQQEDCESVRDLILKANGGSPVSLTTSWYSALAHIPGKATRAAFFRMLSEVTDPRGELLVAPSVSGDLVELQEYWKEKRLAGDIAGYPIEVDGDVIYRTELSQENFWHVFGPDLWELLAASLRPGQRAWLEAIRLPGEEFRSRQEEQANYRRTRAFNRRMADRLWTAEDFREVHTAIAIRSGSARLGRQ
jgi:hypothetical protein